MTRVLQQSPTRIHLRSRPPAWLICLLWLAFVAYLFWVCPSHTLDCRRSGPHAADVRVRRQLMGLTLSGRTFTGVVSSSVERSHSPPIRGRPEGRGVTVEIDNTSRIVFSTSRGTEALTQAYSAGLGGHQRVVEDLNRFLGETTPDTVRIPVPTSGWIWLGAGFLGFVAVGILVGSWCDCVVDSAEDTVRISWAGLLRPNESVVRLSDVDRFLVMPLPSSLGGAGRAGRGHYTLGVRLQNGEERTLTRQGSSRPSARLEELADLLERFRREGRG